MHGSCQHISGWDEIKNAKAELEKTTNLHLKRKLKILPLHSTIPQEDQQKAFIPAEEGTLKIILATNIAESSITINDVLAVVDSGLVRELNFDAESGMATMETPLTSRSSATQRLGRAGRVAPGKCYRLFSRGVFEAVMPDRPTPEIQRTGLEATCLRTCNIPNQQVETFLGRALDPPPKESVSFAMQRLVKLGAIRSNQDSSQVLTPLGRLLSMLPLDPGIGRMLIVGVTMQCLSPCLTAAACLSSRNVFNNPVGFRDEARQTRRSLSESSDILTMVRAYDIFWEIKENNGWQNACDWAFDNFISVGAMTSIESVRVQLLQELNRLGLVPNDDLERVGRGKYTLRSNAAVDRHRDNDLLATAVWATAFPDNLAARRKLASFGTLRTRTNAHAGLHPNAVGFHRKPPKESRVTLPAWYSYKEMVFSSQVFLRDCSALTPEQVVLFGGYPMKIGEGVNRPVDASNIRGVLDDWIAIKSSDEQTIDLLLNARHAVNAAIEWKTMHPGRPLEEDFQDIVNAVCHLCEKLDRSSKSSSKDDDSLVEDWSGRFRTGSVSFFD
jgi:ATP-dependent RNA helicase DHX36